MDFRMQPATQAGQRFVGLAEVHAKEAAQHADRHDRTAADAAAEEPAT